MLVDSSAWYALVDRGDRHHATVQAILRSRIDDLTTTNFIADETVTLLRSHVGWDAAYAFGTALRSGRLGLQLRVTPADEDAAWDIFRRYRDHVLSFTDCTSAAVMQRLGIAAAVTLDKDFRILGVDCLPDG